MVMVLVLLLEYAQVFSVNTMLVGRVESTTNALEDAAAVLIASPFVTLAATPCLSSATTLMVYAPSIAGICHW